MKRKILSMLLCMAMVFSLISFSPEESFANTTLAKHKGHTISASNVTVNAESGVAGANLHTAGQYIAFILISKSDYEELSNDPLANAAVSASNLSGTHSNMACKDPYAYGGLPFANVETKDIPGTIAIGSNSINWNAMGNNKEYKLIVWSESGGDAISKADEVDSFLILNNGGEATALTLDPSSLAGGTVGAAYSQTITAATGGAGGYTYAVTTGTLPDGLTMNTAGVISGTPTTAFAGDTNLTVTVTDSASPTPATATATVIIGAIAKGAPALPTAAAGIKYKTGITLGAIALSGGTPTATWAWEDSNTVVGALSGSYPVTFTNANYNAPASNLVSVTLVKGDQTATATAPTTSEAITANTIKVTPVVDHEYGVNSVNTPVFSNTTGIFTSLSPFTNYYIFARLQGTAVFNASAPVFAQFQTAKAAGPVAPAENITGSFPSVTSINLAGIANSATGLEAAVAIDGTDYGTYADLTVNASGNAIISGLAGVTTNTKVRIRVKETATVLAGADKEISVTADLLEDQDGSPAVTGGTTATFGTQLTAADGTLTTKTNLTYKWYRSANATYEAGTDTEVATGTTYTPVEADITKYLIVVATSADANGTGFVATSAVAKAAAPGAPTQSITGTFPVVAANEINLAALANNAAGLEAAVATDGAIYAAYAPLTVDGSGNATISGLVGVTTNTKVKIRVAQTATTLAGADKEISVTGALLPDQDGSPALTGGTAATFGTQLTANAGTLTTNSNLTYKWYRSANATYEAGTDTEVGTGTTYTPVEADIANYLIVVVKSADATGSGTVATAAVAKAAGPAAPVGVAKTDVIQDGLRGTLTGVDDTMEYSMDGGAKWTAVPAGKTSVDNLGAGSYTVRVKETATHEAGTPTGVLTIAAAAPEKITGLTASGDGKLNISWAAAGDNGSPVTGYNLTITHSGIISAEAGIKVTYTTGAATAVKEIKAADEAALIVPSGAGFKIEIDGIDCPVTATSSSIISNMGVITTSAAIGNVTSYVFTPATNGTTYYIDLSATNAVGTSVTTSAVGTPAVVPSGGGGTSGGGGGATTPTPATNTNIEKSMVAGTTTITAKELQATKTMLVKSDKVLLNFNEKTVQNLQSKAKSTVEIVIADVSKKSLTAEAQGIIGDRPLYNIVVKVDGKEVSTFGDGKVDATLLYTPKQGEDTNNLFAYYINDKNEMQLMEGSKYSASAKGIVFTTTHFSKYAVGSKTTSEAKFADVQKGSWYYDHIYYLVNKGMIKGMTDTTFEPESNITRAQFVTILANMSGANLGASATSNFVDVSSQDWYASAVTWAVQNGIAKGLTDTSFAPNANITREQLSTMIDRYASSVAKITLSKNTAAINFTDSDAISGYAKVAVGNMQQAGIINGIKNADGTYGFAPQNKATRGEATKMVAELVKLTEKK